MDISNNVLVQLSFKRIVKEPMQSRYLMLFQDNNQKDRYLQIYIGDKEGEHVEAWVSSITPPRPMTYDVMHAILDLSNNLYLSKVIIDGCKDYVFHAKMYFIVDGDEKVVDCRPSDAVAIALRLGVPIFAESCILDEHGILLSSMVNINVYSFFVD